MYISAFLSAGKQTNKQTNKQTYIQLYIYIYIYRHICMYNYLLVNQHKYGTLPFLTGKLTISMDMFNHYFDITRGYPHGITIVAPWSWPRQDLLALRSDAYTLTEVTFRDQRVDPLVDFGHSYGPNYQF